MAENDATLWMWIAGLLGTAWLGVLSLYHRGLDARIKDTVPRTEYEAEKEYLNKRFDVIDGFMAEIRKVMSARRKDDR